MVCHSWVYCTCRSQHAMEPNTVGSESWFLPTPLEFDASVRGSRRNIAMTFGMEKIEWCGYPMVNIFKIRLLILTEFTNVTDRQPARGVYRYIYPKISNRFVYVWDINTCFEIAMTSQNVYLPPPKKKSNSWLRHWRMDTVWWHRPHLHSIARQKHRNKPRRPKTYFAGYRRGEVIITTTLCLDIWLCLVMSVGLYFIRKNTAGAH